jgi:hypothetical protein
MTSMRDSDQMEIVRTISGRLCRWSTLAVSAGLALAAVSASLEAARAVAVNRQSLLVVSDSMTTPTQKAWLHAYIVPRHASGTAPVLMAPGPHRQVAYASFRKADRASVAVDNASYGPTTVQLRGLPYGPMLLAQEQGIVHIISAARPVVLVDLTLVTRGGQGGGERLITWEQLHQLSRSAEVGLFFEGAAKEYLHRRDQLPATRRIPLLYMPPDYGTDYGGLGTLKASRRYLGSKPVVVLTDAAMVAEIQRQLGTRYTPVAAPRELPADPDALVGWVERLELEG